MKKLLSLLMIVTLILGMSACSSDNGDATDITADSNIASQDDTVTDATSDSSDTDDSDGSDTSDTNNSDESDTSDTDNSDDSDSSDTDTTNESDTNDINNSDDSDSSNTDASDSNDTDANDDSDSSSPTTANNILGITENGTYTNDYFGFSMTYPTGWYVMSQDLLLQQMAVGLETMDLNDIKLEDLNVLMLFGTAEEDVTVPSSKAFNSNIIINAELMSGINASITTDQYAEIATGQLEQYGYSVSAIENETIDQQDLTTVTVSLTTENVTIYQKFYMIKIDDYIFNFIFSYDENTEEQALSVIQSLQFTK